MLFLQGLEAAVTESEHGAIRLQLQDSLKHEHVSVLESFVWLLASKAWPRYYICPSPAPGQIAVIAKIGAGLHGETDVLSMQLQSGCCLPATRSQLALNPMLTPRQSI